MWDLTSARYFFRQPESHAYLPETFAQEGFIHCTADLDTLVEVANAFFADLPDDLLVLEIDPNRLNAPLKFEPPVPPTHTPDSALFADAQIRFPHIYGPLNREAITRLFTLSRSPEGQWQMPA